MFFPELLSSARFSQSSVHPHLYLYQFKKISKSFLQYVLFTFTPSPNSSWIHHFPANLTLYQFPRFWIFFYLCFPLKKNKFNVSLWGFVIFFNVLVYVNLMACGILGNEKIILISTYLEKIKICLKFHVCVLYLHCFPLLISKTFLESPTLM